MRTIKCRICENEKCIKAFYKLKEGRGDICRTCYRVIYDEPAINGKYRNKPRMTYLRKLARKYNMTVAELDDIRYSKQKNCCKICDASFDNMDNKNIHIDHDHTTDKFRGFLCCNCNRLLGDAKDDQEILESAIRYLDDTR